MATDTFSEKPVDEVRSGPAPASSHDGSSETGVRTPPKEKPEATSDLQKADSQVVKAKSDDGAKDLYAHLPDDEAAILRRQALTPEVKAGVKALYRYSSTNDIIIIVVASICAIAAGAALPLMTVIFGNLQHTFQDYLFPQGDNTLAESQFKSELARLVLYFVYLAIGEFVATYIATVGFIYTGEHVSAKIREHYLESCMQQNIGFFDKLGSGEVTTRITADTNLIQDGMSEKVGLTLQALATFVTAFVIGFIFYWRLTLILSSTVFALLFVMGGGSTFIQRYNKQSIDSYAQGGSLAEEVISSIRNAVAFGTQDRLAKQYDAHLIKAEGFGFKVKGAIGVMVAGMMCECTRRKCFSNNLGSWL